MAVEPIPTPAPTLFVGKGKAPTTEKVRLVQVATGAVHEAWPVDAREHVKAGDFVYEADYVAAPVVDAEAEAAAADAAAEAARVAAAAEAEAEAEAQAKTKADPKKGK